jgi:hypothetical protein
MISIYDNILAEFPPGVFWDLEPRKKTISWLVWKAGVENESGFQVKKNFVTYKQTILQLAIILCAPETESKIVHQLLCPQTSCCVCTTLHSVAVARFPRSSLPRNPVSTIFAFYSYFINHAASVFTMHILQLNKYNIQLNKYNIQPQTQRSF